jgi:hypothetical protein
MPNHPQLAHTILPLPTIVLSSSNKKDLASDRNRTPTLPSYHLLFQANQVTLDQTAVVDGKP